MTKAISTQVLRSRRIREAILRMLFNTYEANPDVFVPWAQICEGFTTSSLEYAEAELNAEIVDLRRDGMAEVAEIPTVGRVAAKGWRITSRGRDFYRGNCPWAAIDEFTGDQTL